MAARQRFGTAEMAVLGQAMEVAEERVSEFFRLSDGAWRRYPYEIRTRAELLPSEVSREALALVLKLHRPPSEKHYRGKDFYRICLQDHNLLGLVRREGSGDLLLPVLVYVMAHELVHVVRFYRFQHLFEATPRERETEECKVHGLALELLRPVRLPSLPQVLKMYQELAAPDRGRFLC